MTPYEVGVWSNHIIAKFQERPEVEEADSFFVYFSAGNEVKTHGLLETLLRKGKIVTVPKIIGKGNMDTYRINRYGDLIEGTLGFLTSRQEEPYRGKEGLAVCVTPGIAFTNKLERLGNGSGSYDRFFKKWPGMFRISLAYENQIVDKLPTEEHDEMVDMIITENRIIH